MRTHIAFCSRHVQDSTLQATAGVVGVFTLQALCHFLAGLAIAAFLLPEGGIVVLLGLVTAALMKTLYNYLNTGRFVVRDAGYVGVLLAGGILWLCYSYIP